MKKPQIRSIIPHFVRCDHSNSLSGRVADLHAQVIESRLGRLDLTTEQKLAVIEQIIANLKCSRIHTMNQ